MAKIMTAEEMFLGFLYNPEKDGEIEHYKVSPHSIGNESCPDYFDRDDALILANCTDEETSKLDCGKDYQGPRVEAKVALPTIKTLMKTSQTQIAIQQAIQAEKQIIIPVTEYRPVLERILGHFLGLLLGPRRNHFVTLHYNPVDNTLSLLDSRPWWISWLYPTAPMKNMFQEGLKDIITPEQIKLMKFNLYYQGVQKNDIDCGYWTIQNMKNLMDKVSIPKLAKMYNAKDASAIVESISSEVIPLYWRYKKQAKRYGEGDIDDLETDADVLLEQADKTARMAEAARATPLFLPLKKEINDNEDENEDTNQLSP